MMQHTNLYLITLVSFLLISKTLFSNAVIVSDLDKLCLQLKLYHVPEYYCHRIFNQDIRSKTAKPSGLAKISVDILTSNAAKFQSSVSESLKNVSKASKAKHVLETCSSLYTKGESKLKEAKDACAVKNYKNAADALKAYTRNTIEACFNELASVKEVVPVIALGSRPLADIATVAILTQNVAQSFGEV